MQGRHFGLSYRLCELQNGGRLQTLSLIWSDWKVYFASLDNHNSISLGIVVVLILGKPQSIDKGLLKMHEKGLSGH